MAKLVENVFVDVTGIDARSLIAQHQKHFRGNVIARWVIDGRTYVKVPYISGEIKTAGLSAEEFKKIAPTVDMNGR